MPELGSYGIKSAPAAEDTFPIWSLVDNNIRRLTRAVLVAMVADGLAATFAGKLSAGSNLADVGDAETARTNLGINIESWVTRNGGGGRDIATHTNVTGAISLDLAEGSVQLINGSTAVPTFTVTNPSSTGEVEFELFTNQTHAPVWFSGITWVNGIETIAWDGTEEHFLFKSTNGGTAWRGYHLTPTAPILSVSFPAISGTLTLPTVGAHRIYNDSGEARTIVSVRASVGTAPTGAALKIDINKNGSTIFTTRDARHEPPLDRPVDQHGQGDLHRRRVMARRFLPDVRHRQRHRPDGNGEPARHSQLQAGLMPAAVAAAQSLRQGRRRAGVPQPPVPHPTINLVYSTTGYASPEPLHEATVSGPIVPWLNNNEAEIERTMWFLDTPADDATLEAAVLVKPDANPSPPIVGFVRADNTYHYNAKGGQDTPNPWQTTEVANGDHTWKVAVRYTDQTTSVTSATFTVTNGLLELTVSAAVRVGVATTAMSGATNNVTVSAAVRVGVATRSAAAPAAGFDAVNAWYQFFPAGNGVTAQHNSMLAGLIKHSTLQGGTSTGRTDEIQYPQRGGAWSSPEKVNTNMALALSNTISNGVTSAVAKEAAMRTNSIMRKAQAPENGGFGSLIGDGDYGAMLSICWTITQRKHSAKYWIKPPSKAWQPNTAYTTGTRLTRSGVTYVVTANHTSPATFNTTNLAVAAEWVKTKISTTNGGGYTPGLPTATTTLAEDAAVSYALLLSGSLDTKLAALAVELIDNQSGGVPRGYWAQAAFQRAGWELFGPWSPDFAGITPNFIGSTILQTAATVDGYDLALNARARELLGALADTGFPKYEVFTPSAALDDYPGHAEITVGTSNPDAGTGGDLSTLAAEAYRHVFDVLANEMADRCDFRDIPHLKPIMAPNLVHPGASPDGDGDGGAPDGWAGTGDAPDGGDLYQPYNQSRQINLRYLDLVGRDRLAYIDIDFYGRNSLLTDWEVEVPALRSLVHSLVLRYLRPFASSECGWTAAGDKDTAIVDRVKLAGFLNAIHNPITGLFASVPTAYVVHYLPDGDNNGQDRYRLNKELDDVGSPNPWDTMAGIFPGRLTNRTDFVGQT